MTEDLAIDNGAANEEDPRAQLSQSISEGMAALSEAADTPTGVDPASSMFTSSGVDLTSDSWMLQLADSGVG